MKTWKKGLIFACCAVIALAVAGFAGKRYMEWREDGLIEVNGEMVQRDRRGIRGSQYLPMLNKLEEAGFPEHKTEELKQEECMKIPVNGYLDETTGIHCIYEITYTYNGEIIEANVDVINLDRVDNATFLETAELYLGFWAGLPYEGSDEEQAREWLSENISTVNRGEKTARTTIGDVTFQLLGSDQEGSCGARTLLISKPK